MLVVLEEGHVSEVVDLGHGNACVAVAAAAVVAAAAEELEVGT